jgi:phage terminase small subunit
VTPKQSLFVAEYLKDLNATQAAIRAGYSEATAYSQGQRMLKNVEVANALSEAQAERAEKCGIDAEWVLKEAQKLYEAARDAAEYSPAVAALKLVGTHVDVQAFRERVANELSGQTTTRIELVALDDGAG